MYSQRDANLDLLYHRLLRLEYRHKLTQYRVIFVCVCVSAQRRWIPSYLAGTVSTTLRPEPQFEYNLRATAATFLNKKRLKSIQHKEGLGHHANQFDLLLLHEASCKTYKNVILLAKIQLKLTASSQAHSIRMPTTAHKIHDTGIVITPVQCPPLAGAPTHIAGDGSRAQALTAQRNVSWVSPNRYGPRSAAWRAVRCCREGRYARNCVEECLHGGWCCGSHARCASGDGSFLVQKMAMTSSGFLVNSKGHERMKMKGPHSCTEQRIWLYTHLRT